MSTFEGNVLRQTIAVAATRKLEPAALLAVVEVESAGKSMEEDGKTPCLLFERHVFYRELVKKYGEHSPKLKQAVNAGLANASWQPKTQYKDQGRSALRLALFAKARSVDAECAIRSCSWGVGQTMGFLAEELKFKDASQMFDYIVAGGVPAQVECMIREIERKRLIPKLNGHDWAGFAKVYNGASYKKMQYDSKMAAAYLKWKKVELPKVNGAVTPKPIPVEAPASTKPTVETKIPPQAPEITKSSGGAFAGIVAFLGGLYAYFNTVSGQLVGLGVMITAMALVTIFVIKHRSEREPQLGTLASVDTEQTIAVVA
jgi:hypothetical protein